MRVFIHREYNSVITAGAV